jgi:hypothetical protein
MVLLGLALVGAPLVLVLAVVLGVRVLRWVRRNRAQAAAMMTGTYLGDVAGGRVETNDDGTVSHFLDWLSGKVDAISSSPHGHPDAADGGSVSAVDGGSPGHHHDAGYGDGGSD